VTIDLRQAETVTSGSLNVNPLTNY